MIPQRADDILVSYDPHVGWLLIDFNNGKTINIEGLSDSVRFQRGEQDSPEALPLWLDHGRADTLAKMVAYVSEKVKISPGAKTILDDLLPEIREIVKRLGEASEDSM